MSIYVKSGSALTYLQSILNDHTASYQKSMEQIASGNKYTSVGEDPISVCESAKLQAEIDANSRSSDNVDLGKDMLSMTEGYQENIMSNIQRIRDLSVEASNGTYSSADKDDILKEIRARLDYIDNTASSANFNGVNILDGSANNVFLQIGSNSDATMDVGSALIDVHTAALNIDIDPAVTGENWTMDDIGNYINNLDAATSTLLGNCAQLGGYLNRLDSVSDTLTTMGNNLTNNKSVISDTDTAEASADLVKYQILQDASVSILTQANQVSSWALKLLSR